MKYARILILVLLGSLLFSCRDNSDSRIENRKIPEKEIAEIEPVLDLTTASDLKQHLVQSPEDLKNLSLVDSFYSSRNYNPAWNERRLREELYLNLSMAPEDGLRAEDYHFEQIQEYLTGISNLDQEERNHLELLLTDAFFEFARHLNHGKLDPRTLYRIWDIKKDPFEPKGLLEKGMNSKDISSALEKVRPDHMVYKGLKRSLQEYRQRMEKQEFFPVIATGEIIKPGDSSARISVIAQRLNDLGFYTIPKEDTLRMVYDQELQAGVEQLQATYGIETDGAIGNRTIAALNMTDKDKYEKILVNLERWRWYPRDLGSHYLIINIPDFRLTLVRNHDTIAVHRTMVGTEARKTPFFSDEIEHLVYNPTWTLPPTIKGQDVIPAAARDPSYLINKNMSVFDRTGRRLDPREVDWKDSEVRNFTIRQEAGSTNPLGRVKIIYPNRYSIYLHDTPSKELFKKNARARSSGCVRVENALDLAAYLLDNQEAYDQEKIEDIISSGKTTTVKVTKNVQVHHFYWTAWREKDQVLFADDIYKQDPEILRRLRD